jgi:hypothetical protein
MAMANLACEALTVAQRHRDQAQAPSGTDQRLDLVLSQRFDRPQQQIIQPARLAHVLRVRFSHARGGAWLRNERHRYPHAEDAVMVSTRARVACRDHG